MKIFICRNLKYIGQDFPQELLPCGSCVYITSNGQISSFLLNLYTASVYTILGSLVSHHNFAALFVVYIVKILKWLY